MIRKRAHIPDYLNLILYWPLCTLEHLFLRSQIDVLELCCICNFICLIVGSEAKIGERSYGCLALKGNFGTKTEFGLKEENVTKVTPFVQWTKKSDAKKGELNLLLRHWSSHPPPQCDIVDRVLAEEKSERRKLSCRSSARVYLCWVNIVVNIKIYVGIVH